MALIFTSQGKRRPAPLTLTLEHRGRTRVWRAPLALMLAAGIALVTIGLVAIALTLALFFKEEVFQSIAAAGARELSNQHEQVATLRSVIDRMSSKHLLDQSRWESRLIELQQRQALLDSRQAMLASLSGAPSSSKPTGNSSATRAAGVRAANALDAISAAVGDTPDRPANSLPETVQSFAPLEPHKSRPTDNWGPLRGIGPGASLDFNSKGLPDPGPVLASIDAALARGEQQLLEVIQQTERRAEASRARFSGLFAELGLAHSRFASPNEEQARGGPLVPVATDAAAGSFEASLARLQGRMAEAELFAQSGRRPPSPPPAAWRDRPDVGLRLPDGPVYTRTCDAHGPRFPGRMGRTRARHRAGPGDDCGMERRLRPDGRDRAPGRPRHPLRPPLVHHGQCR